MEQFTQYLPYDALAKRTLVLDQEKLTIHFKSLNRNFTDEYPYAKINPTIKSVRRGEREWTGVVYGLVVTYIVFLILTKMSQALYLRVPFIVIQVAMLGIAAWLGSLMFLKKEFHYIFDTDGECILMIKATPKANEFLKKLKGKLGNQGSAG
jgi:hypothetical protein